MRQIELSYGDRQTFRRRSRDLNILGSFRGVLPVLEATWSLDDGPPQPFYVESVPADGIDYSFQYKKSPARLRLPHLGDFNLEIPTDHPALGNAGTHALGIRIVAGDEAVAEQVVELEWDPIEPDLPIDLSNLKDVHSVQEIAQVVDGHWDIDPMRGVIRTAAPAAPDSLLLLGSPTQSQEATYEFRYLDGSRSKYVGFSDFFVGHEIEDPSVPIKPGWSTVGLATLRPRGEGEWEARIWIARGDKPGWRPTSAAPEQRRATPRLVRTEPAAFLPLEPRRWHHVRHQVEYCRTFVAAKFRVWPTGEPEPDAWTCSERSPEGGPPVGESTFGLFQHSGFSSEWRSVKVSPLA